MSNARKAHGIPPPHPVHDRRIEAAARAMHKLAQATVDEDKRASWHGLPEDERLAWRELFAAGLQRFRDAGGEL